MANPTLEDKYWEIVGTDFSDFFSEYFKYPKHKFWELSMRSSNTLSDFYKKYAHLITFNDLKLIDLTISFSEQHWSFKEDLLQIKYQDIVIDVGWYPEFEIDGNFGIKVVKNANWYPPLVEKEAKHLVELEKILRELVLIYCEN